jgi:hypothetical protein
LIRIGRRAAGFLINKATKEERGWKVAVGADLPSEGTSFLPSPEDVCHLDVTSSR